MKVFVAGATGALGKQLVPVLVANGHDVVGMTRTEAKRDQLRSVGAQPVVADALDGDAVKRAVGEAEPDVIVHELTAIPPAINMRRVGELRPEEPGDLRELVAGRASESRGTRKTGGSRSSGPPVLRCSGSGDLFGGESSLPCGRCASGPSPPGRYISLGPSRSGVNHR